MGKLNNLQCHTVQLYIVLYTVYGGQCYIVHVHAMSWNWPDHNPKEDNRWLIIRDTTTNPDNKDLSSIFSWCAFHYLTTSWWIFLVSVFCQFPCAASFILPKNFHLDGALSPAGCTTVILDSLCCICIVDCTYICICPLLLSLVSIVSIYLRRSYSDLMYLYISVSIFVFEFLSSYILIYICICLPLLSLLSIVSIRLASGRYSDGSSAVGIEAEECPAGHLQHCNNCPQRQIHDMTNIVEVRGTHVSKNRNTVQTKSVRNMRNFLYFKEIWPSRFIKLKLCLHYKRLAPIAVGMASIVNTYEVAWFQ